MSAVAPDATADAVYDPLAPDVLADPYPVFERLRASGTVQWHRRLDSWVVTGHAECLQILGSPEAFASDFRRIGDEVPDSALTVQMLDPPEHTPIRHLLAAAVRAQGFRGLYDEIAAVVRRRIDAVRDADAFDFVTEVARPAALAIVCRVLGAPVPDGADFEATSNAIVRSMDGGLDPGRVPAGVEARRRLAALVAGWMADASPGTLLAFVAENREAYGVGADLAANSVRAVLHAGYESASRLLGNVARTLTAEPERVRRLADPAVRRSAVDELIRYDPPVQADARACLADTDIGGQRVRRGDVVVLLLGAANRDPRAFPDPDALILDRAPNRHLGFGSGAHSCLGSQLATVETQALLDCLVAERRILVPAGEPIREDTATLRGFSALPVRWATATARSV